MNTISGPMMSSVGGYSSVDELQKQLEEKKIDVDRENKEQEEILKRKQEELKSLEGQRRKTDETERKLTTEIELAKQNLIEREMREIELSKNAEELRKLYAQVSETLSHYKQEYDKLTLQKKEYLEKIQFFTEDLPRLEECKKDAITNQKNYKKEFIKKTQFLAETKEAFEKQEQMLCEEVARLESKLLMEQERYKGEATMLDRELNQYRQQLANQKQLTKKAQQQTIQAQTQRNRELQHAIALSDRYSKRACKLYALQERLNHHIARLSSNEDFLQQELENLLAEFQYNENVDNVDFQDNLDLVSLSSNSMTDNSPSPSPRTPKSKKSPRGKSPRAPSGKRINMQGTAELFLLKKFKAESDLLDQLRTLSKKYVEALKDENILSAEQKQKVLSHIDRIQGRHDGKRKQWEDKNKPSRNSVAEDEIVANETQTDLTDANTSDLSTSSALGSAITDYDDEDEQESNAFEEKEVLINTIDEDLSMRLDSHDTEILQDQSNEVDTTRMSASELADWTKLSKETDRIEKIVEETLRRLSKAIGISQNEIEYLLNDTLVLGKPLRKMLTVFGDTPSQQDEDDEYENMNDDIFYDLCDDLDSKEDKSDERTSIKLGTRVIAESLDNLSSSTTNLFGVPSKQQQPPLRVLDRKSLFRVKELSEGKNKKSRTNKRMSSKTNPADTNVSDDATGSSSVYSSDEESSDDEEDEMVDEDVQSSLTKVKWTETKQKVMQMYRDSNKFITAIDALDERERTLQKESLGAEDTSIGFQMILASPYHCTYLKKSEEEDAEKEDELFVVKQQLLKKLLQGEKFNVLNVNENNEARWYETTLLCDDSKTYLYIKSQTGDRKWALEQIQDVIPGQKTVEFLRFGNSEREDFCFSILHNRGVLNLELIEGNEQTRNEWVKIMLTGKAINNESKSND